MTRPTEIDMMPSTNPCIGQICAESTRANKNSQGTGSSQSGRPALPPSISIPIKAIIIPFHQRMTCRMCCHEYQQNVQAVTHDNNVLLHLNTLFPAYPRHQHLNNFIHTAKRTQNGHLKDESYTPGKSPDRHIKFLSVQ